MQKPISHESNSTFGFVLITINILFRIFSDQFIIPRMIFLTERVTNSTSDLPVQPYEPHPSIKNKCLTLIYLFCCRTKKERILFSLPKKF